MQVKLYSLCISNASHAVKGMMALKGIEPKVVQLLPGIHHRIMRLRGFPRPTVPAIKLDGRKIQGSREIARALDELVPEPPLFPSDPAARVAVEDAERWADEVLQDTPRRIMRLSGVRSQEFRRWIAANSIGMRLPGLVAALNVSEARRIAKVVDADEPTTRRELEELPRKMDHVAGLISDGVLDGNSPNAADFQVAGSVRLLLMMDGVRQVIDGTPAAEHARRLFPEPFGGAEPIPWVLPRQWLPH